MNPCNSSETNTFSNIWSKFRSWVRYYFCFCKGVLFASGLLFSDKLIEYSILRLSITYIDSLDPKGLMTTAILAMIVEAVPALLEIVVMEYTSKALSSRLLVITISSLFYIIGLALFFVRSSKSVICALDIAGLFLSAVGHAAVQPLIGGFIVDQFRNIEPDQANPDNDRVIARKNMWCRVVWSFSALAALLSYYFDNSGRTTSIVSKVVIGNSLILFLFYHSGGLANILHDLEAFLIKMKSRISKQERHSTRSPEEEPQTEQQRKSKYFRMMGCMWTTFLLFGLLLSAGKTIFPYVGQNMKFAKYLPSLVIIQSISRKMISYLFELLLSKWVPKAEQKKAKLVRICLGMLLPILCFIVAWQTKACKSKNMNIIWLAPQYCLLGFMEGLAQDGLDEFMIDLFPESRKNYVSAINTFVIGLGNFGNILSFYGTSSLLKDKEGLLHNYVDLARYFEILTIVGSVNFCYHSCISLIFYYKRKNTAETSQTAATIDANAARVSDHNKHCKCLSELLSAFMENSKFR